MFPGERGSELRLLLVCMSGPPFRNNRRHTAERSIPSPLERFRNASHGTVSVGAITSPRGTHKPHKKRTENE